MTPYTPTEAEIEAAARAIHVAKGLNPDALHEHREGEAWPKDAELHNGNPAHYGWRSSVKLARPALIAAATARTNEQRERVGT